MNNPERFAGPATEEAVVRRGVRRGADGGQRRRLQHEGVQLRGHTSHDAGLVPAERRQHHAGLHQRRRLHGLDVMGSHRALHPVRRADAVFLRHVPVRRRLRRPTGDCLCQGQWHVYSHASPGNACLSGNCRDDSDCPGTVCAPSVGFGAAFFGYVGYYCQTPRDQCRCDADCASPLPSCAYNPEIGAWACASFGGAG